MTTPEEYYELIKDMGAAGQLFYLRKGKSDEEYVFDCVIVDTSKKTETINRLKRASIEEGFIGFPGTPEFTKFMDDLEPYVGSSENNQEV
jgi:hypothetical protein